MSARRGSKASLGVPQKEANKERRLSVISQSPGHKLKKNRRDGTPEKSATPSQDALAEENQMPSKNIIWNEEIEKLQIKEEELQKVREPQPPSEKRPSPVTTQLTVRKLKPASEWDKPKPKAVIVARPAPPDAPIRPMDYSGFAGPRYDDRGDVIPHSLLGSYDEFRKEAVKRGDLLDLPPSEKGDAGTKTPTLKYEKKKKPRPRSSTHADESNALVNWQLKMMERKRQQGYISKLLQKNPEELVMNQADGYRQTQEERYIVDRTIPAVDYGKGYRVGSEFWKQQEQFGDDETGIHMTLTQTERGYPPPVQHIGIPQTVCVEKGWSRAPSQSVPIHYPWDKAPYLATRKKQLQKIINELDEHHPEFEELEVVGTSNPQLVEEEEKSKQRTPSCASTLTGTGRGDNLEDTMEDLDPLRDHPDVHPAPIFGPSIQFSGQPARWTGNSYGFKDQTAIEARVTFESYSGDRVTSYLTIVNDGTTAIYYDWKKLPKDNPFDLVHAHVQRFYFNNSSGVILPGETMKFPFVFKSPNAGVFSEQWIFETRPVVCGGGALIVSLRGIALQEDTYKAQRRDLERELEQKQAEQVVTQILDDLLEGIRPPDRSASPIDAYITEEEIFSRNNPKIHYKNDAVQELKQLFQDLYTEEDRDGRIWDLCVDDLKDEIMALDEEDERKEPFLHQLNTAVSKMSFSPAQPVKQELYKVGYQLLLEAVDGIVGQSMLIRQVMGLPEMDTEIMAEDYSDSRSKKGAEKGKAVQEKKGTPVAKESKGGKGKETAKPEQKGKTTPAAKKPPSRGTSTPGPAPSERERTGTPTSMPQSPITDIDPVLDKKYKEKFFAQAHIVMCDMLDKMDHVFGAVIRGDAQRRTLRP